MKHNILLAAMIALAPLAATFAAEDDAVPPPPTNRPDPTELRGRLRNLSPEARENRLKQLRARFGVTNGTELEKRREELRRLPPAEREARIREWRERNLNSQSPIFNRLTPAERETKRAEIRSRVENQIKNLESRQAISPLTAVEQRRLDRFRQMSRRLEEGTALGSAPRGGTTRPPGRSNTAPQ